jgi:2,3,4,5-tetrahydropyridine-2-carboxylate N-succinyltransferase
MVMGAEGSTEAKAGELSGLDNLLYRRNSLTGTVEVAPRGGQAFRLNETLHV